MIATVAYVTDQGRLHQVLTSIASWRRFGDHPVAVMDIGLTAGGRERLRAVSGEVTFVTPAVTQPLPPGLADPRRAFAFEQKCLLGGRVPGDPVVFLDADILVVHPTFLDRLAAGGDGVLSASRSAWDADFTWTYTPESLPDLRRVTGNPGLDLGHPVCNSGVWAMRAATASRVSTVWHRMFRAAIDTPSLRASMRPGTEIGDQEFLLPACAELGVRWEPLPGSFNIQVHERRMPWADGPDGHPLGGHPGEPPGLVCAVHYGCEPDGSVRLDPGMIASAGLRKWLSDEYAVCRRLADERTGSGGTGC